MEWESCRQQRLLVLEIVSIHCYFVPEAEEIYEDIDFSLSLFKRAGGEMLVGE